MKTPGQLIALVAGLFWAAHSDGVCAATQGANRFVHLQAADPFHPHLGHARLVTPQWVGEPEVEAVVILAIDDLRAPEKYEAFLRPVLNRLKSIDGRAPVSIFCNALDPSVSQFGAWLAEGLSLEVHTLSHPCPLLAKGDFAAAASTYHGCVDLLSRIQGNKPVAFRMPCCDSMNSPSPRFYAELFNRTSAEGRFLSVDSSVMNILTSADSSLPKPLVLEPDGKDRFRKYIPSASFVTTIENYPYPYVLGGLCWEFPPMVPSDWEAQKLRGANRDETVDDWKAALDATVIKQGLFTFIFHPHGWIRAEQMNAFIDYAAQRYGRRVKFLTFAEALERINRHLLAGESLRSPAGGDNGVRIADINNDGFMDVAIGNSRSQKTRIWQPESHGWKESAFPLPLDDKNPGYSGVNWGVAHPDGRASVFLINSAATNVWSFSQDRWTADLRLATGLRMGTAALATVVAGKDSGARLRDLDRDGACEWIAGGQDERAVLSWSETNSSWTRLAWSLPPGTSVVDRDGQDAGLRWVDLNDDGFDDVVFSGTEHYSVHLFIAKAKDHLGWQRGWSFEVMSGTRNDPGALPAFARSGNHRNNGAWFHSKHLWVQNEDTAHLPDQVDRRAYSQLFIGNETAPKSPEESLATIRVASGFKVEFVAHEPLVVDPVAFDWGADGRLWVAEMRDYPLGIDGRGQPGGVIKSLEDRDQDGRFDHANLFLEGINFPSGVMPWRNGVLVSAAPEVFYAEDTDGDGRADVRRTLFRGFGEGNQQHRVNGFEYGLDHWIYVANGDSGGSLAALGGIMNRRSADSPPIALRRHDFRFRPDDGSFELLGGSSQFGRRRDDAGNWFGNNNPNWIWHYLAEPRYADRNPQMQPSTDRRMLANYPLSSRVYSISRPQNRFNWADTIDHLTSACSPAPYRGGLFGSEFENTVFISEPAHNLIHREVLVSDGVSFGSHRHASETNTEFLASSDNWFRPTLIRTGPDGALYFADMYRLILEHPEYFPDELKSRPDLRAGDDRGRIYRVVPVGKPIPPPPRLDKLSPGEWVKSLENPNGWVRDTAQRLLVHRSDPSTVPKLERLVRSGSDWRARLHALGALHGMAALRAEILVAALGDGHPKVVVFAAKLTEEFLAAGHSTNPEPAKSRRSAAGRASSSSALGLSLAKLARHDDISVRYQTALSLGAWSHSQAGIGLAEIARRDAGNLDIQAAIMTSAGIHLQAMAEAVAEWGRSRQAIPPVFAGDLTGQAVAAGNSQAVGLLLGAINRASVDEAVKMEFAATVLAALDRQGKSLQSIAENGGPEAVSIAALVSGLSKHAFMLAADSEAPVTRRVQALRLLGRSRETYIETIPFLIQLMTTNPTGELGRAALERCRSLQSPQVAVSLIEGWRNWAPAGRIAGLNLLASRAEWALILLSAVRDGQVPANQIDAATRRSMQLGNDFRVRAQAQKLFTTVDEDRLRVIRQYSGIEKLKPSPDQGGMLFREQCAQCHRLQGEGTPVGPDLETMRGKPVAALLTAILDPNQAVDAAYGGYSAKLRDGRELTGMIAAETATTVRLRMAGGSEENLTRKELVSLEGLKLSLMPEGLEAVLPPQQMANLLAYILGGWNGTP